MHGIIVPCSEYHVVTASVCFIMVVCVIVAANPSANIARNELLNQVACWLIMTVYIQYALLSNSLLLRSDLLRGCNGHFEIVQYDAAEMET